MTSHRRSTPGIFSRLSGATSSLLGRCSSHEQSVAGKLGATVLIPFCLGIAGGTYTLWSLTRDWPKAIVFGVLWGGAVLLIDVAVLALLTKQVKLEKPIPLPRDGGFFQRLGRHLEGSVESVFRSLKNAAFPLLRILMAGVLGYVMSHALVLGLFNQRIFSEIEKARDAELASMKTAFDQSMGEAESLRPVEPTPPSSSYDGPVRLTQPSGAMAGAGSVPENPESDGNQLGETPAEGALVDGQAVTGFASVPVDDPQLAKYQAQVGLLNQKLESEEKRRLAKNEEIKAQETEVRALRLEANDELYKGAKSGKPGAGPTYQGILKDISIAEAKLGVLNGDLESILEEMQKVKEQIRGVEQERVGHTTELLRMESELAVAREEARREMLKVEQSTRQAIYEKEVDEYKVKLQSHREKLENMQEEYDVRRQALATEPRSDLLWQEEYLEKIASNSPYLNFWRWMILAMLLMLDTLPVLLKAFKKPGEYDYLVATGESLKVEELR
ncbi:MAG: DUF4407 domain-containing protein, partial [Verrucomicrobiota bacterium]